MEVIWPYRCNGLITVTMIDQLTLDLDAVILNDRLTVMTVATTVIYVSPTVERRFNLNYTFIF